MPKVSIIVSCFNNTRTATHMSMLCIDHIRKFTDEEDYELIIVDPAPKFPIRDDYKTLKLEECKWVRSDHDIGYTRGMNMGAALADNPVLVFIQNDVFVHEGWLKDLLWYIENGYEAVFPDQVPRDRAYVLASYKREHGDIEAKKGGRDAGLLMITKDAFMRSGKWDETLSTLAERDFYERMGKAGVNWTDTNKVLITHVMAATNLDLLDNDPEEYNRRMDDDARRLNG